jgi:hypothetical protein
MDSENAAHRYRTSETPIRTSSDVTWTQFGRSSRFREIFELLDSSLSALF